MDFESKFTPQLENPAPFSPSCNNHPFEGFEQPDKIFSGFPGLQLLPGPGPSSWPAIGPVELLALAPSVFLHLIMEKHL